MHAPAALARLRAAGVGPGPTAEETLTVHRVLTAIAALSVLWGAESSYGAGARVAFIGIASVAGFIGGIAVVIGATLAKNTRTLFYLDLVLLALSVLVLIAWVGSDILSNTSYRTDEEVFVQYGTHLISQGRNPYGVDMTPAFQMFPLPPQQFTPRLDGSYPADMGYPSLPMLLTWVGDLFTGGYHTVIFLNLAAATAAAILAFAMLPVRFRPLGVILTVGMPGLVLHVQFGFIQVLMLPFLLAASWNWYRTGQGGRLGRAGLARAICLGLAVSIQQLAWFTVPFLLVGIYLMRRSELGRGGAVRVVLKYSAVAAGTFAALNAPFAVASPKAWFTGVLEPLTQHAIPLGNGLIGITQTLQVGSGNLTYYGEGALLLLLTLLVAYALYFRVLGSAVFVLPFIGLLFSARSLAAYFVPLAVLWGVSLVSADREAFAGTPRLLDGRLGERARKLAVIGSALPSLGLLVLAVTSPPPLKVEVVDTEAIAPLHFLQQMTVQVTNTTSRPISPHFLTTSAGLFASTFWDQSGPATLAPHQTASYTLTATSQASMRAAADDFKVMAVTDDPPSVSWSPLRENTPLLAAMDAGPGNTAHPAGSEVVLKVQLRNATTGEDVHRAGVRVSLAQTMYTPGFAIGTAVVDGVAGKSLTSAETDADGIATFTVRSDTAVSVPILFQASIDNLDLSYSVMVPLTWK